MNKLTIVSPLIINMLIPSCGQELRIERNNVKVDGIPFYVKAGKCVHTSIFSAPYYRLTLQKSTDGQKAPPVTLNVSPKTFQGSDGPGVSVAPRVRVYWTFIHGGT